MNGEGFRSLLFPFDTCLCEDLLKTYENSKLGLHIGTLTINAIACADDIALVCDNPYDLQIHINQSVNYSDTHRYKLQLASVFSFDLDLNIPK
jgi:hypothetical protein